MTGAELLRRDHEVLRRALVVAIAAHVPDFNLGIEDARHPLRRARQAVLELSLTKLADAVDARHHPEAHEPPTTSARSTAKSPGRLAHQR